MMSDFLRVRMSGMSVTDLIMQQIYALSVPYKTKPKKSRSEIEQLLTNLSDSGFIVTT